ncbi:Uma2 family endonuclease [Capilliphycus salinus ALCB114379]|uniref:Uma2 family endonuclease n=1 Tax=Capilliphycus salinus TaxID=2768948 RepID=UPI0039A733C3
MTQPLITKPISKIELNPGSKIKIYEVNWQEFEGLIDEFGERRNVRMAYHQGTLEIIAPLPEHERLTVVISDLVKVILRVQKQPGESLRSITLKRKTMAVGVEPDDCFYIKNYRAVIGKNRLDLDIDPPPDLAIETDVTSFTEISAYEALKVPEVLIYAQDVLTINLFQGGKSIESQTSLIFPYLPIVELIPETIKKAKKIGTSQALEEFETRLLTTNQG